MDIYSKECFWMTWQTAIRILSEATGITPDCSTFCMEDGSVCGFPTGSECMVGDMASLYDPFTGCAVLGGDMSVRTKLFKDFDNGSIMYREPSFDVILADMTGVPSYDDGSVRISIVEYALNGKSIRIVPYDPDGRVVTIGWERGSESETVRVLPGGVCYSGTVSGKKMLTISRQGHLLCGSETIYRGGIKGIPSVSSRTLVRVSADGTGGAVSLFEGQELEVFHGTGTPGLVKASVYFTETSSGKQSVSEPCAYTGIGTGVFSLKRVLWKMGTMKNKLVRIR